MSECVFCEILAGRLPASVVYQDEHCTVFMDINPLNPGHMLVIPNYHASGLAELDENTAAYLFKIARRAAGALRHSGIRTEGVNIFLADGHAAGQDVFHAHLHVAPRYEGDGFRMVRNQEGYQKPDRTQLNLLAQQIKAAFEAPVSTHTPPASETAAPTVRQQMRRRVTPELYTKVRRLWMAHSIAEDQRDIPGLMSTLTSDCVYTFVNTGVTWEGHEGATRFYTELLTAFPDIKFHLQNVVIGPQGVFEEARVTATSKNRWQHYPATGEPIEFNVIIFFPYDPQRELFTGERVFMFMPE